jgi:hypothetical protein
MDIEIYGLVDPRDERIKYVGASKNSKKRLAQHLESSKNGFCSHASKRSKWIYELRSNNLKPAVRILETCNEEISKQREDYWISHYYNIEGDNLANSVLNLYGGTDLSLGIIPIAAIKKLDMIRSIHNISRVEMLNILIDKEFTSTML